MADIINQEVQDERTPIEQARRTEIWKYFKQYGVPFTEQMKKEQLIQVYHLEKSKGTFDRKPQQAQTVQAPVTSDEPMVHDWLGKKLGHCVMQGDRILHKGLESKEAALAIIEG